MGNYSLVINSTFQPFSFERYMQPYQLYGQAFREQLDMLAELQAKASIWEGMADRETDPETYERYKKYSDALKQLAYQIGTQGLSIGSRQEALDLRAKYASDIIPIENAYQRRYEQAKAQREILLKDPTHMFKNLASLTSLDKYLNNLNYDTLLDHYSGALLTQQVAGVMQHLSKQYREGKLEALDKFTNLFKASYGLSDAEILQALQDPRNASNKFIKAVMDTVVGSSKIPTWGDEQALDTAYKFAAQGLSAGIGQDTILVLENKGNIMEQEYKYKVGLEMLLDRLQRGRMAAQHHYNMIEKGGVSTDVEPSPGDVNALFNNGKFVGMDALKSLGKDLGLSKSPLSSYTSGGGSSSKKGKSSGSGGSSEGESRLLQHGTSIFDLGKEGYKRSLKEYNLKGDALGYIIDKHGYKIGKENGDGTITFYNIDSIVRRESLKLSNNKGSIYINSDEIRGLYHKKVELRMFNEVADTYNNLYKKGFIDVNQRNDLTGMYMGSSVATGGKSVSDLISGKSTTAPKYNPNEGNLITQTYRAVTGKAGKNNLVKNTYDLFTGNLSGKEYSRRLFGTENSSSLPQGKKVRVNSGNLLSGSAGVHLYKVSLKDSDKIPYLNNVIGPLISEEGNQGSAVHGLHEVTGIDRDGNILLSKEDVNYNNILSSNSSGTLRLVDPTTFIYYGVPLRNGDAGNYLYIQKGNHLYALPLSKINDDAPTYGVNYIKEEMKLDNLIANTIEMYKNAIKERDSTISDAEAYEAATYLFNANYSDYTQQNRALNWDTYTRGVGNSTGEFVSWKDVNMNE